MHKRGWTYFRVSGSINGRNVSGEGRIPFVYSACKEYSPWIELHTGGMLMVDTNREAYIYSTQTDRVELYDAGSFFEGLARPWMGLHAIDTVRRDAAKQQIGFETQYVEDSKKSVAQVKLITDEVTFIYTIDLKTDIINEISFLTERGIVGNLEFTYLQDIEGLGAEFSVRSRPRQDTTSKDSDGLLWLMKLLENSAE